MNEIPERQSANPYSETGSDLTYKDGAWVTGRVTSTFIVCNYRGAAIRAGSGLESLLFSFRKPRSCTPSTALAKYFAFTALCR
ncbi:hypothetical protein J6590_056464 [Homalodisca vitripennis]|nr:hypothetical protein J6590_056464 [Homalodisca vitripennis]